MSMEARNRHGFPVLHSGNNSPLNAKITDNSNRPMPWVALGCFAGGMGFVAGIIALLLLFVGGPALIQAEGRALKAELRAEFAQDIADAKAQANDAGTDAKLWKNKVNTLEARFNERR